MKFVYRPSSLLRRMGSSSISAIVGCEGTVGSSRASTSCHVALLLRCSALSRYIAAKASAASGFAPPIVMSRVTGNTDSGWRSMKPRMAW